jgi:hypothetical protein
MEPRSETQAATVPAGAATRPEAATWLRAEGAVAFAAGLAAYAALGGPWWVFAATFLLPDLAMIGYLRGPRIGAALYNAAHTTLAPAALAAAGLVAAPPLLPLAAVWLAHIGFDRALGYGLKHRAGFRHTHLGPIGR